MSQKPKKQQAAEMSRRQFLRGLGGFTLALPCLPSLLSRELWAQSVAAPKNLVMIMNALGHARMEYLYPFVPGARSQFGVQSAEMGYMATDGRFGLDGSGAISPVLGSNFRPYAPYINFYRGLDYEVFGDGHTNSGAWGNYGTVQVSDQMKAKLASQTLDNYLAHASRMATTPAHIAPWLWNNVSGSYNPNGANSPTVNMNNGVGGAQNLFDFYFKNAGAGNSTPANVSAKTSIIDLVMEDYRKAKQKLGGQDRPVFEEHIESLREIERSIASSASCQVAVNKNDYATPNESSSTWENYENAYRDQIRIAMRAMKCGMTRILTIHAQSGYDLAMPSFTFDSSGGKIHDMSHDAVYSAQAPLTMPDDPLSEPYALKRLLGMQRFFAEKAFLRVLQELNTDAGNGETHLHRTVVAWNQEHANAHSCFSVPAVIATRIPGFSTGRYVDYTNYGTKTNWRAGSGASKTQTAFTIYPGLPYRRYLVSLVDALGFNGGAMPLTGPDAVAVISSDAMEGRDLTRFNELYRMQDLRIGLPKFKG